MTDRPPLEIPASMSSADVELVAAARALLAGAYVAGRHEVVAAMRMSDGSIQLGVHVDGSARRSSVCAECVAAGNVFAHAATTGAVPDVVACVAVLRLPGDTEHVIEPCGVCAELITDYWPDARVWVTRGGETRAVTAAELLPAKRRRGW